MGRNLSPPRTLPPTSTAASRPLPVDVGAPGPASGAPSVSRGNSSALPEYPPLVSTTVVASMSVTAPSGPVTVAPATRSGPSVRNAVIVVLSSSVTVPSAQARSSRGSRTSRTDRPPLRPQYVRGTEYGSWKYRIAGASGSMSNPADMSQSTASGACPTASRTSAGSAVRLLIRMTSSKCSSGVSWMPRESWSAVPPADICAHERQSVPPGWSACSTTVTRSPCRAASIAAGRPAVPAPTTSRSVRMCSAIRVRPCPRTRR